MFLFFYFKFWIFFCEFFIFYFILKMFFLFKNFFFLILNFISQKSIFSELQGMGEKKKNRFVFLLRFSNDDCTFLDFVFFRLLFLFFHSRRFWIFLMFFFFENKFFWKRKYISFDFSLFDFWLLFFYFGFSFSLMHFLRVCSCERATRATLYAVEEKRESALWWPIASHSVPMGVH